MAYGFVAAHEGPFEGQISRRKYPKALRPSHVYRADGRRMPYEAWFFGRDTTPITAMRFEDNVAVVDADRMPSESIVKAGLAGAHVRTVLIHG